jgi:hypothetical protein
MTRVHQVTIITFDRGAGAVLCTTFIRALASQAMVNFCRRDTKLGRTGMYWEQQDSNRLLRCVKCKERSV